MSWKLVSAPTGLALALAEAQLAARVDVDESGTSPLDADIRAAIDTYVVEAETETKRAVIEQTWRLTLDGFPPAIELFKPPLLAVDFIKFYDLDGVQRTLAREDYLVDDEREPGYIVPADGRAWPPTRSRINAVQVQIRCGYGADYTAVPASIRNFIRARIAEQYNTGKHAADKNVKGLLSREVVY